MKGIILTVGACLLISSCATQRRGFTDFLRVDTVPQGAKVETSIATKDSLRKHKKNPAIPLEYIGCESTPCSIQLLRQSEFITTITHDGYEPVEFYVGHALKSQQMIDDVAIDAVSTAALTTGSNILFYGYYLGQFGVPLASSSGLSTLGIIGGPAAAAGAAAAVTSTVVDAASGANMNLYPNPVVLKLALEGTPTKTDPRVAEFRKRQANGEPLQMMKFK